VWNDPNPLVELLSKKRFWFAALTILLIVVWEVLKSLVPKGITALFGSFKRASTNRKNRLAQERSIRSITAAMAEANWIGSLPALSSQPLGVPIESVYQPLFFRYEGLKLGDGSASIQKVLSQDFVLAFIGPPGSGKSTVISMLARSYAKDSMEDDFQVKESRLPLLIPMRQLPAGLGILPNVLCDVLQKANCDVTPAFLIGQLEQGACALLFDGLDECGDQIRRAQVVQWIKSALLMYSKNRFIFSCRTNEWQATPIPGISVAHILPFDEIQCRALIRRWFSSGVQSPTLSGQRELSPRALPTILFPQDDLRGFASNPLMFTITILLSLRHIAIPKKRADLFLLFLRTLLGQWDRVKGTDLGASDAHVEGRLRLFQRLAGQVALTDLSRMSVRICV
jgi:hypothetical protein